MLGLDESFTLFGEFSNFVFFNIGIKLFFLHGVINVLAVGSEMESSTLNIATFRQMYVRVGVNVIESIVLLKIFSYWIERLVNG